jgi:coenzyme F420 hydrogenase subunit beta
MAGAGAIKMVLTAEGRERPVARDGVDAATLERINAICPGTRVEGGRPETRSAQATYDVVWGYAEKLAIGYAGDPEVRYRASTGGVLTALGQFLLTSGRVKFVLHVAASATEPLLTERRLSFDAASVLEGAGSRYGPAAALVDFNALLDRGEPFALIAKPCHPQSGSDRSTGESIPAICADLRLRRSIRAHQVGRGGARTRDRLR